MSVHQCSVCGLHEVHHDACRAETRADLRAKIARLERRVAEAETACAGLLEAAELYRVELRHHPGRHTLDAIIGRARAALTGAP